MYTEEKPRRGGLLKEFVMRLILIIIFVLLLLWIIPWSKMDVNPLKDQIFNANLQTMKEAGITYFTTERLPQNEGDKVTLTLQKMLDLKLIIPFTDRNGKSCDVKKSYITLEKQETEYLMKVNLKCGDEEDYILVHLGCYSYCDGAICEKKGKVEKTKATPTPTGTKTPRPTPTATPKPTPTPTSTPKPTPTPTPLAVRVYEYKKTTKTTVQPHCEEWSKWQEYYKSANDGVVYGESATKKVEPVGVRQIVVAHKDAEYKELKVTRDVLNYKGEKELKVCTAYNYFINGSQTYQITSEWTYGQTQKGTTLPSDSIVGNTQTQYEVVGTDFDVCAGECTNNIYLLYRKKTRTVTPTNPTITVTCANVETKKIPIYINERVTTTEKVKVKDGEDIKKYVAVYRVSECTKFIDGSITTTSSTKWSTYNDTKLLNDGYHYTGNYK